jgi:hypothetical protein
VPSIARRGWAESGFAPSDARRSKLSRERRIVADGQRARGPAGVVEVRRAPRRGVRVDQLDEFDRLEPVRRVGVDLVDDELGGRGGRQGQRQAGGCNDGERLDL